MKSVVRMLSLVAALFGVRLTVAMAFAVWAGCASERAAGPVVDDGLGGTRIVRAPEVSRCAKFKPGGGAERACEEARALGLVYVRALSVGDAICMEGGFGERPGHGCQARGRAADVGTNRVLVDVREARPDSKWFGHEARPVWFEEGALVDLFLAERGF